MTSKKVQMERKLRGDNPIDFDRIKKFTCVVGCYHVDIGWDYLEQWITKDAVSTKCDGIDMNPDFQRGYVWTPEQKVAYVEFIIRGGMTGKEIYCNCPRFQQGDLKGYVLVDGKQRIEAVIQFLNNNLTVFGNHVRADFDYPDMFNCRFSWNINHLKTRKEVLQWYLELNEGGTVHAKDELDKVRELIAKEA